MENVTKKQADQQKHDTHEESNGENFLAESALRGMVVDVITEMSIEQVRKWLAYFEEGSNV